MARMLTHCGTSRSGDPRSIVSIAFACTSGPAMRSSPSTGVSNTSVSATGLPTTRTLPEKVPGGTRPSSTSSADIRGMFPGGPRKSIHVVRSLCAPCARRDAVGSSSTCCPERREGPRPLWRRRTCSRNWRGPRRQLQPDGRARPGSRRADCRRPHLRADRRSPLTRPSRSGRPEIRRDWHGRTSLPSASRTRL